MWHRNTQALERYINERHHSVEREIDFRWAATEAEMDRRVHAIQSAADTATTELGTRLDAMNEFRAAMADQFARAVTREMYDAGHAALSARLEALIDANAARVDRIESSLDKQRGRQAAFAALAAVSVVIITLFIIAASHVTVH